MDEQARRCRYCTAPVATVRCAACFHMNIPDAGFCSGCGSQLGLEPVGEAGSLRCPVCIQPLGVYRDGGGALLDCEVCGGQFVDHVLLRAMVHRHDSVALPDAGTKLPHQADPRTSYIPCPECAALMNRKNFGGTSGVIVDVCKKHGTWFDAGELPRVLSFVAVGGLCRARQRDEAESVRSRRSAMAAAMSNVSVASWPAHERGDRAKDLVDFFMELLH